MSALPIIRFRSFNPYEARFPRRRVVSRDALHLIKILRAEGYGVVVEPDDGSRLYYVAQKGIRELLTDPLVALLFNVPISVVAGLVSSYVFEKLKSGASAKNEIKVVLETREGDATTRYDYQGQPMSDAQFDAMLKSFERSQEHFQESLQVSPPDQSRPIPVYLEHTPRIVGWGNIWIAENGTLMAESVITDDEALSKVRNGELKGYSFGGLVGGTTCSICGGQYVDCNHIAGKSYDGQECIVWLRKVDMAEISLVSDPVQVKVGLSGTANGREAPSRKE